MFSMHTVRWLGTQLQLRKQELRESATPPEEVDGNHQLQHEALLRPELQLIDIIHVDEM
jgi:hypothetical protein